MSAQVVVYEPEGPELTADVSVIIPTVRGRRELLQRAITSVENQVVSPREIVVVIDRDRQGAAFARNLGLERARGGWIAWLDDDDEMLPNHIRVLIAGSVHSGADLIYSCMEVVGGRDPLAVDGGGGAWVNPCGVQFGPIQEHHMRRHGNFIPVTYMVRAELARQVGGMPPSGGMGLEEDYQFLIRLLDAGAKFHHVPTVTWRYHIHGANLGGMGVGGPVGTGASNPIFKRKPGAES